MSEITQVIDDFKAFGWDDENRRVKYLQKLIKEKSPDPSHDEIKGIIQHELATFKEAIDEQNKTEFFCADANLKYGYPFVLQWILGRWFMKCKTKEDLPSWYLPLCSLDSKTIRKAVEDALNLLK